MTKTIACLNIDCAKAKKHTKGCMAYGEKHPENKKKVDEAQMEYEHNMALEDADRRV